MTVQVAQICKEKKVFGDWLKYFWPQKLSAHKHRWLQAGRIITGRPTATEQLQLRWKGILMDHFLQVL